MTLKSTLMSFIMTLMLNSPERWHLENKHSSKKHFTRFNLLCLTKSISSKCLTWWEINKEYNERQVHEWWSLWAILHGNYASFHANEMTWTSRQRKCLLMYGKTWKKRSVLKCERVIALLFNEIKCAKVCWKAIALQWPSQVIQSLSTKSKIAVLLMVTCYF